MQANNKSIKQRGYGQLRKEDKPLYLLAIEFVEEILLKLIQDDERENALTEKLIQLSIFNQNPVRWALVREKVNKHKSSEDIGISHKSNIHKNIFVFEAKRLNNTFDNARKKEYVIGKKGGIERFKRDLHGKDLAHSGMIAYVQTDDFNTWENKINDWINEEIIAPSSPKLKWQSGDKLIKQNKTLQIAKYTSCHSRLSKEQINLTHLWVNLVD
jgi:hypothetical protein